MTELHTAGVGPERMPRKEFEICRREGDNFVCVYHGKLQDLTDSWVASGVALKIIAETSEDVWFVANIYDYPGVIGPDDLKDDDEEMDYDVSG